jgi:hypothetical protein
MTIATSFKPRPTNCPRSTSTGSEWCRTRPTRVGKLRTGTRSAQTREKTPSKPVRGVSRNPLRTPGSLLPRLTSRSSAGGPLRKCHGPDYPSHCGATHGPCPSGFGGRKMTEKGER